MSFPEALLHELRHGPTAWAVLAWLVVLSLARVSSPVARTRLRVPTALLVLHAVTVVVTAAMDSADYVAKAPRVAGLAFVLLAVVGVAQVALFWIALPKAGVRVPRIVVDVVTAIAAIVALIAVGKRAGFSVAGLITTSAVLTAVIGFSMQDTLGNLMGGLALQMDSSIKVGDWISLGPGQPVGQVTEIRWRYTAIETRNWETVVIPNSVLMKGTVIVLGRRAGAPLQLRRHLEFHVDYRTPPTEVIAAILRELRSDPVRNMAETPPPQAIFFGIRDSYAVYAVRYWLLDLSADDGTDSEVRIRVYYALQRAGIPLAIPAQAVFVTSEDEERRERKAREEHVRRLAAVDRVDLFRALSPADRDQMADRLRPMPFARGEAVTHEGDLDDGLFIIVRGEAAVRIGPGEAAREVARLGPGQFFGEMSLMTGEVRSATVIALTDLECYRLDKPVFEDLLRQRPELAEAVAELLAERRVALASARDEAEHSRHRRLATAKQDLLGRIRNFFALEKN
ncbi:MAG TPA: mechanosensitive ion channel family protein [Kofleriaceae bacterium]|nr:mechanosensitive ion channel family protein [Kofleriaceae bacterium]